MPNDNTIIPLHKFVKATALLGDKKIVRLKEIGDGVVVSKFDEFIVRLFDTFRSLASVDQKKLEAMNAFLAAIKADLGPPLGREASRFLALKGGDQPLSVREIKDTVSFLNTRQQAFNIVHEDLIAAALSRPADHEKTDLEKLSLSSIVINAYQALISESRDKGYSPFEKLPFGPSYDSLADSKTRRPRDLPDNDKAIIEQALRQAIATHSAGNAEQPCLTEQQALEVAIEAARRLFLPGANLRLHQAFCKTRSMTNALKSRVLDTPDALDSPKRVACFFPRKHIQTLEAREIAEIEKCTEIVSEEKIQEIRDEIIASEIRRQTAVIAQSAANFREITGVSHQILLGNQDCMELCVLYGAPLDEKFWAQIREARGQLDAFSRNIGAAQDPQALTQQMVIALDKAMTKAGASSDPDRKCFLELSFALATVIADKDGAFRCRAGLQAWSRSNQAKDQLNEVMARDDTEGKLAAISQNLMDTLWAQ